jgi:hypothetical protein
VEHYVLMSELKGKKLRKKVDTRKMKVRILLRDPIKIMYTMAFIKETRRLDK